MKKIFPLAIGLMLTIKSLAIDVTLPVGTIEGAAGVSSSGAATYEIPISVPQSELGYSPSLKIVYNSLSANGILGYGWNLLGTSGISRCGKTFYYDGEAQEITFSSSDNLMLDGVRLLLVSGTNLSDGAVYGFEGDPSAKIQFHTVGTYTGFTIYYKDGSTKEYGLASGYSIGDGNITWMWLLNKATDNRGRTVSYSYSINSTTNEAYLSEIVYDTNRHVLFTYESLPYTWTNYIAGKRLQQTKRLLSITSYVQSAKYNEYLFTYATDGNYSKLSKITLCGTDNSHYNPTSIAYTGASNPNEYPATISGTLTGPWVFYADLNGDGMMDFVLMPMKHATQMDINDYACVYLARKNYQNVRFEKVDSVPLRNNDYSFWDINLLDIDGDGAYEIDILRGAGIHTCYAIADNSLVVKTTFSLPSNSYRSADLNGDGRPEFLMGDTKQVYNCMGELIASAANVDWNNCWVEDNFIPSTKFFNDFDGNGKEDLIIIGFDKLRVYELTGTVVSEVLSFANSGITTDDIICCGDFNGDGLTDIVAQRDNSGSYTSRLYLSTGTELVQTHTFETREPVRAGEFNKDGKSDLFYKYTESGVVKFATGISHGTGFTFSTVTSSLFLPADFEGVGYINSLYSVADFDGDGRSEFGLFRYNNHIKLAEFPDSQNLQVAAITDGLGKETSFTYKTSADPTACYSRVCHYAYPVARLPRSIDLVSQMTTIAGSFSNTNTYSYISPRIHITGRGFLGFGETSVTDINSRLRTNTVYTLDSTYYYPSVSRRTTLTMGDDSISREDFTTVCMPRTAIHPKAFVPYVSHQYLIDYLKGNIKSQSRAVDAYGNQTWSSIDYGSGLSETMTVNYSNSTSPWHIGRVEMTSTTAFNSNGSWTDRQVYTYNANNLPIKIVTYTGDGNKKVSEETISYDNNVNVVSRDEKPYSSSNTLTTSYQYTTDYLNISKVTDPLQLETTYAYDSLGRRTSMTNSSGQTLNYAYDTMGRLIQAAGNDSVSTSTERTWDNTVGNSVYCKSVTGNDGSRSRTWYDAFGRELRSGVLRYDGTELLTDNSYDTAGRVDEIIVHKGGSEQQVTSFLYDDFGRKVEETTSGHITRYAYDGNSTTVEEDGIPITRTTNAKGELVMVADPKGCISYTLRPDGQLLQMTAFDITTSFTYDDYGRQTNIEDPSAGLRSFTYNSEGLLSSETDADGRTVSMTYDSYGRLKKEVRPEMTTLHYYNNRNQLYWTYSSNGSHDFYTYDNLGRLSKLRKVCTDDKWLQREYTYDLGHMSAIKYTNQTMTLGTEYLSYSYGSLCNISFDNTHVWELTGENYSGMCLSDRSATTTRTYSYRSGWPLTRKLYGAGIQLASKTYTYNAMKGSIISVLDGYKRENFGYDNMNRLITYGSDTVSYDAKGNILRKSDVGMTFGYTIPNKPYAVSLILPDDSAAAIPNQYISYNSFERPDTITQNGKTATFIYDGKGNRVRMKSTSSDIPTRYYVDDVYEEETLNGTTVYRLYLGGDAYSAPAACVVSGSDKTMYYITRDHQGSITHITNAAGQKCYEYSYDAWGRQRNPANYNIYAPESEPTLFLGRGNGSHEHLPWFGLVNMNARLYDPVIGRFLSPDNYIQNPESSQNLNRYSYCLNNPLKYTDTSGDFAWAPLIIGAAIGGTINTIANLDQINSFWHGLTIFGVDAIGGGVAPYIGSAAPFVVAGITSVGNDLTSQGFNNGYVDWEQVGTNLMMAELIACYSGGLSGMWAPKISSGISSLGIKSPVLKEILGKAYLYGSVGATIDAGATLINGGTSEDVFHATLRGGGIGLVSGAVSGFTDGIRISKSNNVNPWTGNNSNTKHLQTGTASDYKEVIDFFDIQPTINRINRGDKLHYRHDGDIFYNNKNILPQVEGGYREWVVPTSTLPNYRPGPQRILTSDGMWFYTPDHYETFIRIK